MAGAAKDNFAALILIYFELNDDIVGQKVAVKGKLGELSSAMQCGIPAKVEDSVF